MSVAEDIRLCYEAGLHLIPKHMHGGVVRYMESGIRPGDFLFLMLRGELDRAKLSADPANLACWREWGTFLSDHLPLTCHNTPLKVDAWMVMKGLSGMPG